MCGRAIEKARKTYTRKRNKARKSYTRKRNKEQ
jgi:hypothetical protein